MNALQMLDQECNARREIESLWPGLPNEAYWDIVNIKLYGRTKPKLDEIREQDNAAMQAAIDANTEARR